MSHNFSKDDLVEILKSSSTKLFESADRIRKEYKGDFVHLRGLIEFTNICKCNCLYCGLRKDNTNVQRYRLSEKQILDCVKNAVKNKINTVVLQGGEDEFFTSDKIASLIKKIKKYDIAVTLSIGERSFEEFKAFKKAGADRYLLRIETTDKELYKSLHPKASYENRVNCLYNLKSLGFEVGTGCIVGLPNQSIESLAEDIIFFKEIDADMVGIGPFISHPDTPLKDYTKNNFDLSLRVMALIRLLMPDINIPATSAMESVQPNGRIIALKSGANVIMPNMTDVNYRKNYEIYPGKICINDSAEKCALCIKSKIESIGRKISETKGFRTDNT